MKEGVESTLKFKKLKRRLGLPEWQVVGLLESTWKLCRTSAKAGDIGQYSNEDIAAAIEYAGDADEMIAALVESGWLDEDPEYRLIVHDWSDHVPTYLKGNFAKHGKTFADQSAKQRKLASNSLQNPVSELLPSQVQPSTTKYNQREGGAPDKPAALPCPAQEIVTEFNRAFGCQCRLTKSRQKQLRSRWGDEFWRSSWRDALQRAGPSKFLRGENDRGWRIDLEFFLRPDTVTKILEGKYDNRANDLNGNHAGQRLTTAQHREQANADAFALLEKIAAEDSPDPETIV